MKTILTLLLLVQVCSAGARLGEAPKQWERLCGRTIKEFKNDGMTHRLYQPEPSSGSSILVSFLDGRAVKSVYTTKGKPITKYILNKLLELNSTSIWREKRSDKGAKYFQTEDGRRTLFVDLVGVNGRAIIVSSEYEATLKKTKTQK